MIPIILLIGLVAPQPVSSQEADEEKTTTSNDGVESVDNEVNDAVNDATDDINNATNDINEAIDGINSDINETVAPVENTISDVEDTISDVNDNVNDAIEPIEGAIDNITGIVDDLSGLFDDILGDSGGKGVGSNSNTASGIGGSIQSFFRDITGWINSEPDIQVATSLNGDGASLQAQKIESVKGAAQIPDLKNLKKQVMEDKSGTPGQRLSQNLETKGESISYANRDDYNQQVERRATLGIAYGSAISQEAQQQIIERQEKSQENTQKAAAVVANSIKAAQQSGSLAKSNQQLAQESQELDVTQQIMQNISAQTGLISQQEFAQSIQLAVLADQNGRLAQTNQALLEEEYQGRIDRAYENVLTAQIAKEVSASTTAERRRSVSAGNLASQQLGMTMLAGNRPLVQR
ncbi:MULTISPECIES: hypothetical protein [unclassified Coleofasciculus]|uniref:hypothetical protein n=1 Tax=unclassified Coleofasciculus TaxID=2692782 RepID=UPI00187E8A57|nr:MULTISPECIES: hypothetical protein [unclassified Coleofasciculus]MBE9124732.1 hypothetical protein [Coleofasciculus sp. LEGE 07081]MBE9148184.1 hypothetical protein [Coleofasciculus sp. LEGE 07092]